MLAMEENTQEQTHEWSKLTDAAHEIGISQTKLSGLVKKGKVQSQKNPYDERITEVDLIELRKMFPPRK